MLDVFYIYYIINIVCMTVLLLINLGFPRNFLVVISFLVVMSFHGIINYPVASYYVDISQHG